MEGRGKKSKQNDTAGFSASWILFSRMRQCVVMIIIQKENIYLINSFSFLDNTLLKLVVSPGIDSQKVKEENGNEIKW